MVASGALTQVAAKGPQDLWLTMEAQMTFWKGGYKRHTNFSVGEIQQTGNSTSGFGRKTVYKVDRSGDLISSVYIQTVLPQIGRNSAIPIGTAGVDQVYYTNSIGHAMISEARCHIGGHEFDTQTGEYMEIWETISAAPEKRMTDMVGYSETIPGLVMYARRNQYLYVPLQFWFNRFYEQALPLIALQYHELHIHITYKALAQLVIETGTYISNTSASSAAVASALGIAQPNLDDSNLLITYVYLDTMERRLFAQQAHEYLFDQVQQQGEEAHTSGLASMRINMNFNHPTQEILWVCQRDDVIGSVNFQGNDWFNWSGIPDSTIPDYVGFVTFQTEPFGTAQITLNGHERTPVLPAQYFRTVQMKQYHTRIPDKHIYGYAFGLYPESVKPSGSLNMSRIDRAQLLLTFPADSAATAAQKGVSLNTWAGKVRCFARSKNVCKIVSGMIGLMYAN